MYRVSTSRHLPTLIFMAFFATPAAADGVSGTFNLDGKDMLPTHVAAFRVRDQFNPREFETYVMLTANPVDRAAISASIDPYTTAINDPAVMHDDYLALSVKANGEVGLNAHVGGTQYIDSSGKVMMQQGSLVATCTGNTTTQVACSVKTLKPVKTMDGPSWTIDVTFDSVVSGRAPGKPVAKGGGEPGTAFLALVAAAQGDDLAKITALLTPDEAADYARDYNTPEENLAEAKSTLGFQLPKQPKITGGEMLGEDTALLEVEGVPYADGKMLYLVEMQRHDGRWGFSGAHVAGMLR